MATAPVKMSSGRERDTRYSFHATISDDSPFGSGWKPRSVTGGRIRQSFGEGAIRHDSITSIKSSRGSLFIPDTISEARRQSLAPEIPAGPAFGEEPPFTLHKAMLSRLTTEYQDWYNEYLIDHKFMVNTHLYEPTLLRKGGRTVPGPSPCLDLPTADFDVPARDDNPAVPVRVWWPSNSEMPKGGWPVFVWAHGGGWILGSKNTENNFTTRIAEWSKCCVVSVGYRLAPENPYPDCLEDFWDVLLWLHNNPELLKINIDRVAIGGSSAGGNIASVVAHQYPNSELPPLKFQMLLVPVTDNTAGPTTHLSWKENEFTPQLPAAKMLVYRDYYLPHESLWTQPEASPIFFSDDSFKKLAPALVVSASADVLRTENELYAAKIKANGVSVRHDIYQGVPHHAMGLCQVLTQGRELILECSKVLRHQFYGHDDLVTEWK
ncbi:AB hydrolase superfamily protein C1039.03 [Taphrina deformans PYCC 5710]|uniref:AB hydrolase superfamily protein C1039.03 n=1 Tax=Taphrina deformans (strain PYCC 5710 / ATCC 11124 / CBS 356.35 / IMI 108563 / JCM 9778 / NBRC 8474) TaxID=1097556 RepID=R4ZYP8_TAPDE|nr:AB hydrolase superfamily protein C1039.03 [Taphrina deformans PYCC 5710]|eukprot:CCX35446.1 AB hydrolase superfamily protein C1039.03 [Taphrina deformans PYCC 5710]